jgi:hypothetical protein
MSDRKGPRAHPSDPPPDDLRTRREEFVKNFLSKGAQLTEELIREREETRHVVTVLEEENARLRAQLASDEAIRDLLRKIEDLEKEKDQIIRQFREVEDAKSRYAATTVEIESELANLANLYVASYQLHSSFSPRGVMRHVTELLAQLVGAEAFAVYLIDDAGKELFPVATEGVAEGELLSIPVGQGVIGKVFATGEQRVVPSDPRKGTRESPAVCFPLRLGEKITGVIAVFHTLQQKASFIQVDYELFKLLGAQAMFALVAARLYTEGGGEVPPLSSFRDLGT